jgi:hypothetical protein
VEPVEINAGAWYLLPLRTEDWVTDSCYSWAVCEPTTGVPLAEVMLDPRSGTVTSRAQPGQDHAAAAASESVRRFAAGLNRPTTPTPRPTSGP